MFFRQKLPLAAFTPQPSSQETNFLTKVIKMLKDQINKQTNKLEDVKKFVLIFRGEFCK